MNTWPALPHACWGLGVAGHVAGRGAVAVDACFVRAQAMMPGVAGVFSDHGRVPEARGAHRAALGKFRRALAIDPDFIEAHVGMARVLIATGDAAAAQPHIERLQALKAGR